MQKDIQDMKAKNTAYQSDVCNKNQNNIELNQNLNCKLNSALVDRVNLKKEKEVITSNARR